MSNTPFTEEQTREAMQVIERAVDDLGFPRINPESLTALREAMDRDVDGWRYGPQERRAYRIVMAGFYALLGPKED